MKLPSSYLPTKIRSAFRFAVVGTTGMFVQTWIFIAALLLFDHPEKGAALYYVAFAIGYLLEMVPNYLFLNWYTFGTRPNIKNAGGLVISAFDSAMRSLIVAIYELGVEEIMVVAHSHCGACHMSYDHFHHEMIARGVTDETLDTIRKCGINLDHWLEGFKDTPESVRKTVETIKTHPLVPKDIVVRGFIIDSETGALEEIK